MTEYQGDKIIQLLKDILSKLEEIEGNTRDIDSAFGALDRTLDSIASDVSSIESSK